jgi:hypothetical protein
MNIYQAGKKGGSVSASMGKKANSTGVKVSASAGAKSGTARSGDPKGCSPMGKGK